jgi:1-acyl-sn-glycerol-3-phosphate acyltransferase
LYFFYFSRFLIRLAFPIFLRRLLVVNFKQVPNKGPLLLASNHPDSFFDALVIGATLTQPIFTLARGDAFKKPAVAFWLRQINLIPVFRGSEGRQAVKNIDITMRESLDAMGNGDAVIVFSEGICVNEWKLRPLGKGTARMAHQAWFGESDLKEMQVIPVGMNYEHFRGTGKRVAIRFGDAIHYNDIKTNPDEYEKWLREFNELLFKRMDREILTIPEEATREERTLAFNNFFGANSIPPKGNFLFSGLGWLGRLIHRPIYEAFHKKVAKITARTVFYDSALFGLLLYLYPVIVFLISAIIGIFAGFKAAFVVFAALPILAYLGNRYR